MPNLFRSIDGRERKPGATIPLQLADGSVAEGIWAGSATEEKLAWWLSKPGNEIAQSEWVSAVAAKADDDGEIIWGDAPAQARLIFVLESQAPQKTYRLAKLVTTAATSAQAIYFRHQRAALFGTLRPDGSIEKIAPLSPEPPQRIRQGELF